MRQPKIGLLPLYLALYDKALPDARARIDGFRETIIRELKKRGMDVVAAPVCRVAAEFELAVKSFEDSRADAIVTLHLAYSPSLESAGTLARTKLPLIVLDTTPTYAYGPTQDPDELMYNHGIHGVQDLCNLLIRNGKAFQIEAGHWEKSDVLDRIAEWARAAMLASSMRSARVGRIGEPFNGMGDFAVPPEVLARLGIRVFPTDFAQVSSLLPPEDDAEVRAEIQADLNRFAHDGVDSAAHLATARASLAVRRWIEKHELTAFSMNFDAIDESSGMPTVPFLEASKGMSRGIGYAGEGDVLTAALVGALASAYPETSFTEMFCPDWENGTVFMSHMAEINPDLCAHKPILMKKPMPWVAAGDPVIAVGRFKAGNAVLANLAPCGGDEFTFIVAPVAVMDVPGEDRMGDAIRGWIKPELPLADFLERYSREGGTHHSAIVYGDVARDMVRFAAMMGWRSVVLK